MSINLLETEWLALGRDREEQRGTERNREGQRGTQKKRDLWFKCMTRLYLLAYYVQTHDLIV